MGKEILVQDCKACHNGVKGYGEDAVICPECCGIGYIHIYREVHDQQLWREQKERKEVKK